MKRIALLLALALIAGTVSGCHYAIIETDPMRVFGLSAQAEGYDLFRSDEPDISYLYDEPVNLTPKPTGSVDPDAAPTETPRPTETPAPTKMPRVQLTPDPVTPVPERTESPTSGDAAASESVIGLHSRDVMGEDTVYNLQVKLQELGYLESEPDGIFGSRTLKALMRFQRDQGLEETGTLDAATRRALAPKPAVTTAPEDTLYNEGAMGYDIRLIHQKLRQYGFSTRALSNRYDEALAEEVTAFQNYAVEYYGTEFDDPVAEVTTAEVVVPRETGGIPDMPALAPEATLRPYHAVDGVVSSDLFSYLLSDRFPLYRQTVQMGDEGDEVLRLQRRLKILEYYYGNITGKYDELTRAAVEALQRMNSYQATGIADGETQRLLYSEGTLVPEAVAQPFYIRVSTKDQRVYVYRWLNGHYDHLVKSMICSTGLYDATPKGVFVSPGHRDGQWHYFVDYHCWAQYAFVITGNILFHSVLYSAKDEDTLRISTLNNLGHKASHGCVRLLVEDAKWIYEHCGEGQVIEVY